MTCKVLHDFMNLAGQQLEDEARDLKLTIDDTRKHLLKKIFELDSRYNAKYNKMSLIFVGNQ